RFAQQIIGNADLAELRNRGFHDFESLEGTDHSRFDSYMHVLFRTVEDVYYQHLQGNLDTRVWRGLEVVLSETNALPMTSSQHVYEVRPRKDHRGVDLISDVLPFGQLWYDTPDNAIGYALHSSRSHHAVIRVYDGLAT